MPHDPAYLFAQEKIEDIIAESVRSKGRDLVDALYLNGLLLTKLPESLWRLTHLTTLNLYRNRLTELPESVAKLKQLRELDLYGNQLTDLPSSLSQPEYLNRLALGGNPLNPELAEAYSHGFEALKAYLRAKANSISLNEAKLILIGEGEVGKTCLMDALLDNKWQ